MDADQMMVLGLVLGALSIPSLLSAFSESRAPRVGTILVLTAGGLIAFAATSKPGGYEIAELPQVVFRVVGQLMN